MYAYKQLKVGKSQLDVLKPQYGNVYIIYIRGPQLSLRATEMLQTITLFLPNAACCIHGLKKTIT